MDQVKFVEVAWSILEYFESNYIQMVSIFETYDYGTGKRNVTSVTVSYRLI